jgi:uncharacterized protein involved in outer membrane biogenesis/gas vesicle protein
MKILKRVLAGVGILLLLLIIAAILIPIMFKGKILEVAKTQMNKQLNATTDFKDVDISLFRHFPNLAVGIEQISIVGKDAFKNDTLIAAKRIDVSVDLMAAINGKYDIKNVALISPRIHAIVHENGEANWNITKPDTVATPSEPSKPFAFKLRKYSIENAYIEYRDEQAKMSSVLENFTHEGSGDFSSDAFTLATHTTADAISFTYGNIPYLNKVKTLVDMDLEVDNKTGKYSFNTEKIQLNGLKLSTKGFVQLPDTINTVMDVQFSTPSNDFKDILSLVPGIYQNNFKDIKTTGKAALNGFVKGTYNAKQMPAYALNLSIENGSFQYPDLPQKVSDIQVKVAVNNPDGITDHTVVNVERGHVVFGADPFDFRLLLKTPVSNQWIDATMKGRLDLSQVQKFVKLEAGTKLSGVVNADVSVKGSVAAAQKQKYDELYAAGTIGLNNIAYASKDYPDGVNVNNMLLTFNPKNVTMTGLKGQYMQINFTGDGTIDNLIGYYLHNEPLTAALHFTADKVDLNKFMSASSTTTNSTTPTPVFIVPDNLDVTLKTEVGSVKYDKITLTDVQAALMVRNQVVALQNVSGKGLDGNIKMSGFYGTKTDKNNPDISFDYTVENVDVQKTYTSVDMVQKMMPAGKYVQGKMTSHLSMTGKMGADMTPQMNTLTGKGDLFMLSGIISGFPVTDQLANKLNIAKLKSFPLKDMKLFFSFANGRLTVDPYKFKIDQIDAEVAGSHGFDQTIQYGVNMAIPTALMGSQGTAMVNNLVNQAAAKGVNVKVGDKVNLAATITGTVTAPKVETNLKSMAGDAVNDVKKQLEDMAKHKADSIKNVVKDTVKAIKTQAVNAVKDELKNQFLGNKDTSKKNNGTNNAVNNAVNNAADKAKDGLKSLFGKKK